MKVHVVSPPSTRLTTLIDRFRERGDVVSHADECPPDADLYLFCRGHESMRQLSQGLVVLDLRHDPEMEAAGWLPYADLCLVRDFSQQAALIAEEACEPERIYVVLGDDGLLALVDQALQDALPPAEIPERAKVVTDPQRKAAPAALRGTERITSLAARLEVAERQADVMKREYRVHSKAPLIGPLVAWLRRNLTSHLREPYLDPTLERQVALNHEVVSSLQEMAEMLANLETRLARMEEQGKNDQ
jgi:hypothetical protein